MLKFVKKFNPHYEYLLISTDEIKYSDPEYVAVIVTLSNDGDLSDILTSVLIDEGYEDIVDEINSTNQKLNDNELIKASEVYNGRR